MQNISLETSQNAIDKMAPGEQLRAAEVMKGMSRKYGRPL